MADVDAASKVTGERVGEATFLVRYQGSSSRFPSPSEPEARIRLEAAAAAQLHRPADRREASEARDSAVARDGRRRVPAARLARSDGSIAAPEEVRAFLADQTANQVEARKMIDKLIASPAFVDHWTVKWGDLLQNSRKYLGEKGTYGFREWIRESIAANKPYDKLVRELLTSRGSSYDDPAANFFRVTREPKPTMEKTTQVFLGVRMVCAQCHDHPFERWTQNQYYQMAAFFSAVGLRPGYEVGEEIVFDQRDRLRDEAPEGRPRRSAEFLIAATVLQSRSPPISGAAMRSPTG